MKIRDAITIIENANQGSDDLREIARGYEGNIYDVVGQPPNGLAADYDWRYEPDYPLDGFHEMTPENWRAWMQQEINDADTDGLDRDYLDIIETDIREPIVVVEVGNDAYIWDGYHRVGGSFVAHRTSIPAIVGTPK